MVDTSAYRQDRAAIYKGIKPIEAFSLFKVGRLDSHAIVRLANEWLEKSLYTESLGELCTIVNPIMSDIAPLFEKAMLELNLNEPSTKEAADIIIFLVLNKIVEKEIEPDKGASFLYWMRNDLEDEFPDKQYVGDNFGLEHIFCWLREIWDCRDGGRLLYHTDLSRAEAETKFKEHLIEEAERILKDKKSK